MVSINREVVAMDVLSRVCRDNGIPIQNGFYDENQSLAHASIYELVSAEAEDKLMCVPTPDFANLVDLGNMQYQLTLHNRT